MHAVLGTTSNHTRHSAGRGAPIPPAGKAAAGTGSSPPEDLVRARIEAKHPFNPDPQERDSRVQRVNVLLDVRVGPLSALHVSQRLGEPARDHLRVEAHRLHTRCIPPNGGAEKRMWAKPQSIGVHGLGPGFKLKIGVFMIKAREPRLARTRDRCSKLPIPPRRTAHARSVSVSMPRLPLLTCDVCRQKKSTSKQRRPPGRPIPASGGLKTGRHVEKFDDAHQRQQQQATKNSESGTVNKASHLSFREVLERGQGDADDLLRGGGGNLPTDTPDAIRSSTVESIGKEGGVSGSESRMGGGVQAARPAWDVSIHTAANSNVQAGSRPRPPSRILSHLTTQSNRLIANTRQLAPKHREEPLDDPTAVRDLIHAQGKTPSSTKQQNPRVHTHERGK